MPVTRFFVVLLLGFAALTMPALAGGGPETTLVVVNADSPTSLRVANDYVRMRDIPANHVLHLDHVPAAPVIPIDAFRERILQPIEDYLKSRGLADDVDTVAYSTGFPYAVDFSADLKAKNVKPGRLVRNRHASLTSLTYLYQRVLAQDPEGYLGENVNGYFRKPESLGGANSARRGPNGDERRLAIEARGAMASKDWKRAAEALTKLTASYPFDAGNWYNLACCLAVLDQTDRALDALEKAVEHGFRDANHASTDIDLEGLKGEPAFERLLDAMRNAGGGGVQPSHGFSARQAWKGNDAPEEATNENQVDRYRLAVMLGWTGAYGNSRDEVLSCLLSAAASDGTRPDGTVYLMVNGDKNRIGPRQGFYRGTIDALARLGRKTEILEAGTDGQDGVLPKGRDDVIGLVTGRATFAWGKEMPPLLPGSIADHLTSFAAHFGTAGQTKCTEFIRHGAAGTSGTVAEPLNAFVKFPVPFIHVHYARGCSLAEAHYQSIWMPYQTMVLGDPLARPFARFADVSFAPPLAEEPLSGTATLPVLIDAPPGHAPAVLELWVDGVRTATAPVTSELTWDTTQAADGWHEIRAVAVGGDSIQTRSYVSAEVEVRNGTQGVTVTAPEGPLAPSADLSLKGKVEGALTEVDLLRGSRVVVSAPVKGSGWRLEVPASRFGEGTTRLRVAGRTADGKTVLSKAFDVTVESQATRQLPSVVAETEALPGLRATLTDDQGEEHPAILGSLGQGPGRTLRHDLADRGQPTPHGIQAEGYLVVESAGTWEIEVRASGPVKLSIGGQELLSLDAVPPNGRVFASVPLELGHHPIVLEARGALANRVGLYLSGPRATAPLLGARLVHVPPEAQRASQPIEVVDADTPTARPGLLNDQRGGKGLAVPTDGFEVHWKRTERNLLGVALFPQRGKGAPAFPSDWIVEVRSSTRGRWKAVKNLETFFCPPTEAPQKDASNPLTYVYLAFDKTSARQLRVRPAPEAAGTAEGVRLNELIVFGKSKRR